YDARGRLSQDNDAAGGATALSRTDAGQAYTVALTTVLGRTTTYQVVPLTTGDQRRVTTSPEGTQSQLHIGTDGGRQTTVPDGTTFNLVQGPDPRFGMQTPVLTAVTVATPGGPSVTGTTARTVTLADPQNLLSLLTQTDITTINGRTFTSVFNAATRT